MAPSSPISSPWLKKFKEREERETRRTAGPDPSGMVLGAPARILARLSAQALLNNYRAIREQVPGQAILPMIKADAYGHGARWAARVLSGQPDLYGFGVATLQEGEDLRDALGEAGSRTPLIVFSGAGPWTERKGEFCEKHALTPVIATDADWALFLRQGWPERIPYELEFNTGMNRLGLQYSSLGQVARQVRALPVESKPQGILSHLAMAEEPSSKLSRTQLERFAEIRAELASAAPAAHFHLANSAGIWNQKHYRLKELTDAVRPGLALYGVPPWEKAPARGILPVLTLHASIVAIQKLRPGDSVGYGATYTVPQPERAKSGSPLPAKPTFVAILAAGYADGIHREMSGKGYAWISGREERFVGRVSMDLCAVSCSGEARVGQWVELLGPSVEPWAQARAAGTIPYELLTSISPRVQRVYE